MAREVSSPTTDLSPEILKQPMHTSVALERKDFDDFNVQEGLHISTMVRDFRSIVAHAEAMHVKVTARYSRGDRPMQISYEDNGLRAEFTLMTRGSSNIPTTGRPARDLSVRPGSRPPASPAPTTAVAAESTEASARPSSRAPTNMPPPARMSLRDREPPTLEKSDTVDSAAPPPSASIDPNSLFIPADDEDDRQWEPPNFEEEPDIVTWDNTADEVPPSMSTRRILDSEAQSFAFAQEPERRATASTTTSKFPYEIAPTQRLSQVKGIFD